MQVPLTGIQRPHWDIRTLEKLRMRSITTDVSVWAARLVDGRKNKLRFNAHVYDCSDKIGADHV